MKTNCFECKLFKRVGFFDNTPACFAADDDKVHTFITGEISHLNEVGCMSFIKKGASP